MKTIHELQTLLNTGGVIIASACTGSDDDHIMQGHLNTDMEQMGAPRVASGRGFYDGDTEECSAFSINSLPLDKYHTVATHVLERYNQSSIMFVVNGVMWSCSQDPDGSLQMTPFTTMSCGTDGVTGDSSALYCTDGVLYVKGVSNDS
jgi:hypothetical protein